MRPPMTMLHYRVAHTLDRRQDTAACNVKLRGAERWANNTTDLGAVTCKNCRKSAPYQRALAKARS